MMTKQTRKQPSFIEEARRRQIIEAAIRTIARRGMVHTTLEDIANEIEVSKGVILYHFKNKAELIAEVINHLISEQRSHRQARLAGMETPLERLHEYIRADMDFYLNNRQSMICWWELFTFYKSPEEKALLESRLYDVPRETLVRIIRDGQAAGVFRQEIDPLTAATLVEGAIEGVMIQWVFDETQVDLHNCGEELISLLEARYLAPAG